jgi:hypothetical protein
MIFSINQEMADFGMHTEYGQFTMQLNSDGTMQSSESVAGEVDPGYLKHGIVQQVVWLFLSFIILSS